MDEPKEWYLDRRTGILYFWPSTLLEQSTVVVSLVETPLIHMAGASYIEIRGLTIEYGRADGVRIEDGTNNRIEECVVRNLGNYGVVINGGTNHGVANCLIYGTGDGGISLSGGDRKKLAPSGHYARNNHIHHIARWSRCYAPAISMTGVGIQAANNLIHDHPHCAILFWGNEHIIELNEIHHVCLETGDVGAIYTGRDYTFRGNIIRHNFIHHTGGVGMGSMGIYMDDCVSGTQIYGNILWSFHRAVFLGGGRDFKVENNIFVDCDPAIELDGRGLSESPVWHNMVYGTMKQRLEDMNWREPPFSTRYRELADLEPYYASNDGIPPGNIVVTHNICVRSQLLKTTWGANEAMVESRNNLFRNPAVRHALTLAINRRELHRVLNFPDNIPIFDVLITKDQLHRGELPEPLPYDPEQAKRFFDEAGWFEVKKDGVRENNGQEFRSLLVSAEQTLGAVYIQDQFRKVGIRMEIVTLDRSVLFFYCVPSYISKLPLIGTSHTQPITALLVYSFHLITKSITNLQAFAAFFYKVGCHSRPEIRIFPAETHFLFIVFTHLANETRETDLINLALKLLIQNRLYEPQLNFAVIDGRRFDSVRRIAKLLNECRSCRLTRVANFCNSLHAQDLSIVGHADPDIRI